MYLQHLMDDVNNIVSDPATFPFPHRAVSQVFIRQRSKLGITGKPLISLLMSATTRHP